MRKNLLRGLTMLLILSFMIGFLPAVSLAADNELVLTKIGHSSTDTVAITNPTTRSVTLTVPFQYSGTTVNFSSGLIIDKAANIGTVVTSFDNGATATIGGAPVVLTATYYKGSDTMTQNTTNYSISVVRAARKDPTFSGTITKSVTGVMPNAAVNDITFTSSDFSNLYTVNDGGAITRISILGSSLSNGSLKIRNNGTYTNYNSGDMINLSNIGNLVFDAVDGGSVSYLVSAYSGQDIANGSVQLNITVNKITVPTISGNISKTVNDGATATFALSDFSSLYNLNLGSLDRIEVTPSNTASGTWYNGSNPITGTASFTASTIDNLKFTGTATGTAAFTWRVSNEAGFSTPGSGTVAVKNVSVPIITGAVAKTVIYNTTLDFALSDFSSKYNLNNGTLSNIVITPTNNTYGTWYKGSTAFTAATAFDSNSIGTLKFKGTMVGQANFTWTVSNEKGASASGSGSVTVTPGTAATNYSTAQNTPKKFAASDFNDACNSATGTNLSYIYFGAASIAGGTLYYGYSSASNPGTAVSTNTVYNANRSPSISNITFVPSSNFAGVVTIPYAGSTTNDISFSGTIKITVGSAGVVSYTTTQDTPKTFSAADFSTATSNTIGGTLSRILIAPPSSAFGKLYYNYASPSNPGTEITSSTTLYPNSAPVISALTFVPSQSYTGFVSIPYTGINANGASYQSSVVIKVTAPADIRYTTISGRAVKVSASDVNSVCLNVTGANLNYVFFTLPAASTGRLYYNYTSVSAPGIAVPANTAFYRDAAPALGNVSFVPAATFTGSATITYTGFDVNGVSYSGKIIVQVNTPAASAYFTDVGQSYNWAAASIDYLFESGIVQGAGGQYKPGANITRGDFILMLYRALGFSGSTSSNFADVPVGSYYYNAIAAAKALGIALGDNNNFYPNSPLTRQDAMALIYRSLLLTGKSLAPGSNSDIAGFVDRTLIANYALDAAKALVKAGIITGSNARINPLGNLSRAEMAVILYRVKTTF